MNGRIRKKRRKKTGQLLKGGQMARQAHILNSRDKRRVILNV